MADSSRGGPRREESGQELLDTCQTFCHPHTSPFTRYGYGVSCVSRLPPVSFYRYVTHNTYNVPDGTVNGTTVKAIQVSQRQPVHTSIPSQTSNKADVLSKWSVEIAAALTSIEAVLHRVAGAQIGSRAAVEVFKRAAGQLLAVPIVLAPPVKQPIHARHGAVVRLDPQAWHAHGGPCGMQPVAQRQQGVAKVPAPLPL